MDTIIKEYENKALSDAEVLKLIDGKANMVMYRNLHKFNDIDEILGPHGACILLFEAKPNYGHWCCLFKLDNNTIEFFNPYGGYPDDSLDFISDKFKKQSNQDQPYLSQLMLDSPYDLTYNEFPFQKVGKNIKSCGRWCAVRLICKNMSLENFADFFFNNIGDELVTYLTMWINK